MSLRKILETFTRLFPSSFNRKYVHTVACTVVFVRPAHFVFNVYPGRNATFPLASCSNKNDGPRSRFNCISTVSCKESVCVEVLTSFYGRVFVDEGQFNQVKVPPHPPSTEGPQWCTSIPSYRAKFSLNPVIPIQSRQTANFLSC